MTTLAQTLPEGGMVPLVIALIAGFGLWLAGVKLVRTVFLALGVALGGFVGAVLIPLTGLPAFHLGAVTINPGFTGLFVGGIIGALIAMGLLRVVITLTAACAFAVVGAMGALVFLHLSPTQNPQYTENPAHVDEAPPAFDATDGLTRRAAETATDALNRFNETLPEDSGASNLLDDLNTEENRERLRDAAERSREFLGNVAEAVRSDFERRPDRDKLVILSATLAGLGLGLLLGVAMPNRSSALVTSLCGSALWLGAGAALIRANAQTPPAFLDQPPLTWAVVWGVVAVIGMTLQFGLIRRARRTTRDDQGDD